MSTDKEKQMLTFEGRPSRGRLRLCNFTSGRKEEEKESNRQQQHSAVAPSFQSRSQVFSAAAAVLSCH